MSLYSHFIQPWSYIKDTPTAAAFSKVWYLVLFIPTHRFLCYFCEQTAHKELEFINFP